MTERREGRSRLLVLHDYGLGGLWWWVWAAPPPRKLPTIGRSNPPFDLYTPKYAGMEITADEFETTWKPAYPAETADE